jgi:aryl-alcohol dehydrogenase-like predicted oxidoreductase
MAASITATDAGVLDLGGDLTVNRLGFGAMRLTGDGIWGPPRDLSQARAVLRHLRDLDVNFIDTADSYGPEVSEQLICEALYPYPEDLIIATKGGLERTGPNQWPVNGRPKHLRQACEGSLKRLRMNEIALYQWHSPDPKVPLEESVGALVELKDEGKIRHIGVSNLTEEQLRQVQELTPVVSIQNRFNLTDRRSEDLVDLCEQEDLVFLPWGPLGDADSGPVADMAKRHNATAQQIVLAWLLARSPAMLPIPGTSSMAHLDENVAAARLTLEPEEIEILNHLKDG